MRRVLSGSQIEPVSVAVKYLAFIVLFGLILSTHMCSNFHR